MDWNLKPPHSWDFTELEQEPFSSFNTVSGPHGLGDNKPIRADFSVDLKLGQVGNSGNDYMVDSWNKNPGPAKPASSSSSSGPAKRSRGAYGGLQAVSCLVDGCEADLSGCRDYHRRHKVCELHSKTAQVSIAGLKQRFCQQCSRFHSLEEFDEGKRSCRKRLDGHNRRRRKPQPEPFSRYGSLFSNCTGTQMLPFSSSLVYPSTAVAGPIWGGISVKTEPDSGLPNRPPVPLPFLHKQTMFLNPSSPGAHKFPSDKHFSLSQGPLVGPTDPDPDPHLSLLRTFPFPESGANNRLPSQQQVLQSSDCALSLLSSPQGLGHVDVPMQLSSVALDPLNGSGSGSGSGSALHCPAGMFPGHLGSDGITNEESSHQTLPSHWG